MEPDGMSPWALVVMVIVLFAATLLASCQDLLDLIGF